MSEECIYFAIDLKNFYASAECSDRGMDPLSTNLVVADITRTEKTICLAVSPSLKSLGVPSRARLFEVVQKIGEINKKRLSYAVQKGILSPDENGECSFISSSFDANTLNSDPSLKLEYIIAPPRMSRYIEISAQIYSIFLQYVSPEDIFQYSIDEAFIDVTPYLLPNKLSASDFASSLIREVLHKTGITATCGIGSNLYLAKVALDIVAKHVPADSDGVRIGILDEYSFRSELWDHTPLTDFWRIGKGTANRLEKRGIKTMGELARLSVHDQEWLYRTFGIDAEILIDHAWGIEPCTMRHIKNYTPESRSLSEGQVLTEPYTYEKTAVIVREMTESLVYQLTDKGLVTGSLTMEISYDRQNIDEGNYSGEMHIDHYGRQVPKSAHGTIRLESRTNISSKLQEASSELFKRIINKDLLVRRVTITANQLAHDDGIVQMDMFTDVKKFDQEKRLQGTMLNIRKRYGKNKLLKGTDFEEGATMRERNQQIGGHKA